MSNFTENKGISNIGISFSSRNKCTMDFPTFLTPGDRECVQFHIMQLHRTVNVQANYIFNFKPTILAAVSINQWMLYPKSVGLWCGPKKFGHLYNAEKRYGVISSQWDPSEFYIQYPLDTARITCFIPSGWKVYIAEYHVHQLDLPVSMAFKMHTKCVIYVIMFTWIKIIFLVEP